MLEKIQEDEEERLKGFIEVIKEYYNEEGSEVPGCLGQADIGKNLDKIYQVENMLGSEEKEDLEAMYPEVSRAGYVELQDFLYNAVRCEENERSLLLLEECEGRMKERRWERVCVTVDGYILGYRLDEESRDFEVYWRMKLGRIGVKLCREEMEVVKIKENCRGFFGKKEKDHRIIFRNENERNKFVKSYLVYLN